MEAVTPTGERVGSGRGWGQGEREGGVGGERKIHWEREGILVHMVCRVQKWSDFHTENKQVEGGTASPV